VTLYHQVTIGSTRVGASTPSLGDRCFVGVGASVLGPIVLGDDVLVGAGAVVLHDAPAGVTLVGVPAVVRRTGTPPGSFLYSRRADG
jgi:serine O-acetyltransferase